MFANSLNYLIRQGTENPSVVVSYSVLISDNAAGWNGRASPCQAMARKPEGDLKQARASALAHAPFKSDEDGRSEAAQRGAKTHHRREDPIARLGSAQSLAWGSGEHVLPRRAQEGNVEHRL